VNKILILGYGNPDRQDDGVAWHVIDRLAQASGLPAAVEGEEETARVTDRADLLFQLQLMPEIAEVVAGYEFVCFVDAHTGAVKEDLHVEQISASYQTSPFTHHMTPQTCLSISENLYQHALHEAILISIRGYAFGFTRELSEGTLLLAGDAVRTILEWIEEKTSTTRADNAG
jgi:hydrogenase maturation protease